LRVKVFSELLFVLCLSCLCLPCYSSLLMTGQPTEVGRQNRLGRPFADMPHPADTCEISRWTIDSGRVFRRI
jgi:hypothetical protein